MDTQLKLICKADKTHLSTDFPVYYFGTLHAKVYAVYAMPWGGIHVLIAAILEEFSYDYREERLFERKKPTLFPEIALNGNEKMKEIHTANFDKDGLTEIVAKSFLNDALSLKTKEDKLKI